MALPDEKGRMGKIVEGADQLSLGISIVVAILFGIGIGILMKNYFGHSWFLWVGVIWGISAAILNVRKAYLKQKAELDKLADDPKYKNYSQKSNYDDEDEDDKY